MFQIYFLFVFRDVKISPQCSSGFQNSAFAAQFRRWFKDFERNFETLPCYRIEFHTPSITENVVSIFHFYIAQNPFISLFEWEEMGWKFKAILPFSITEKCLTIYRARIYAHTWTRIPVHTLPNKNQITELSLPATPFYIENIFFRRHKRPSPRAKDPVIFFLAAFTLLWRRRDVLIMYK